MDTQETAQQYAGEMMNKDSKEYLLHDDSRRFFGSNLEAETWTVVYDHIWEDDLNFTIFSALVPRSMTKAVLKDFSWDIRIGDGLPSMWKSFEADQAVYSYHHYTDRENIQPIVLARSFHGIKPGEQEIQEEFRLFHNLFYDHANRKFIKIHDDGREEDIVLMGDKQIRIKTKALRQFAAVKDMSIVLYIDSFRHSPLPLSAIPEAERHTEFLTDDCSYFVHADDETFSKSPAKQSFSRFLGKRVIAPLPVEKSGIWPYDEEPKHYESFIIGTDANGDHIVHTCDPDRLANNFGANPDAPHYMTPVFFRKEVLTRYFSQPDKYQVTDGRLGCGGLWELRMDNDHENHVVVFLGDLGRDLSATEQKYWASFNIPPDGKISKTCYMRSFRGWFANPESPDLCFKHELPGFKEKWLKTHGWNLLLELSPGDQHLLTALHIPTTSEQAEFDAQVLALTKVLIDSLNEAELTKQCKDLPSEAKGIDKLETYLTETGHSSTGMVIGFMRDLQALRSTGVGHRKGEKYEKVAVRFGIGAKSLQAVFRSIMTDALNILRALTDGCTK